MENTSDSHNRRCKDCVCVWRAVHVVRPSERTTALWSFQIFEALCWYDLLVGTCRGDVGTLRLRKDMMGLHHEVFVVRAYTERFFKSWPVAENKILLRSNELVVLTKKSVTRTLCWCNNITFLTEQVFSSPSCLWFHIQFVHADASAKRLQAFDCIHCISSRILHIQTVFSVSVWSRSHFYPSSAHRFSVKISSSSSGVKSLWMWKSFRTSSTDFPTIYMKSTSLRSTTNKDIQQPWCYKQGSFYAEVGPFWLVSLEMHPGELLKIISNITTCHCAHKLNIKYGNRFELPNGIDKVQRDHKKVILWIKDMLVHLMALKIVCPNSRTFHHRCNFGARQVKKGLNMKIVGSLQHTRSKHPSWTCGDVDRPAPFMAFRKCCARCSECMNHWCMVLGPA